MLSGGRAGYIKDVVVEHTECVGANAWAAGLLLCSAVSGGAPDARSASRTGVWSVST
jgi:hypothetical protein